jgi:hypothetical protein
VEISKLFGLPAHPLFVHLPVVLIPLAAVGAVMIAVRPAWRARLGALIVAAAGVGLAGIQLAIGSGEELEDLVKETEAVERHEDLAGITRLSVLFFFLAVTAFVVYDRRLRSRAVPAGPDTIAAPQRSRALIGLAVLTVAASVLATTAVVQSGHTGAQATWERISQEQPPEPDRD